MNPNASVLGGIPVWKTRVHWASPEDATIPEPPLPLAELIRACAELGNAAAWEAFVSHSHRFISLSILRIVRRSGFSPDVVDDLVQETYLKLFADRCRRLHTISTENPLAIEGYLKTIAINIAQDYVRTRHSQRRGRGEVCQLPEHFEPKAESAKPGCEEGIQQSVLMNEINRHLDLCTEGQKGDRDRIIFWLHYQQGMTAQAISALPSIGLTVKGVESAILRMTRQVRQRIVQLQSPLSENSMPPPTGFGRAPSY